MKPMERDGERRGGAQLVLPETAAGKAVASLLAGAPANGAQAPAAPIATRGAADVPDGPRAGAWTIWLDGAEDGESELRLDEADAVATIVATQVVGRLPLAAARAAAYRRVLGWWIAPGAAIGAGLEVHGRRGRVWIGSGARIGRGCFVAGAGRHDLAIADGAAIGFRASLVLSGSGAVAGRVAGAIAIERGVRVGTHAVVLGGVTLGEHAEVAPGAVVTADVPPFAIVAGNPARVIGDRRPEPSESAVQGRLFH